MLAESVIGIVRAVNGLLEKVNAEGQASIVKSGARLQEGDVLTLLSGEAYIQFIHGFPEALALGKPVNLYGVSPILQYGVEELNEQLVQEAIAKGIDPSLILDVLGSAAAGAVAVGSGGDAFIIDPLFGFGQVTAGYPTGPISFAYEADTQHLFWYVPEETGVIAESELTSEPESIPQIPQFTTNQAVLIVFEDALASGIPDSAGQARTASSSLSTLLTSSPDVAASFAFNTNLSVLPTLKSGGIDLDYNLSPDKRTLTASIPGGGDVMQFELTAEGQLTQRLMDSIDHPTADSDDSEWMRFDLSSLIDVTFTRASDGAVLESRTLPANAVVAGIQDDVPIARAQLTNNEILLDETVGVKVGDADAANDDYNPTTTADPFNNTYGRPIGLVQNANLLDTSTSEMGGDYKNATMTHLLKITDAVSGLQTSDGTPINLFLESNGDITGRAGDVGAPAVFAIRMNPNTGSITVAQYGSIKQFDTNSHDEAVDLTGRISAVVTAKDSDGDESSAEIPIGQLIIFEDDGPKADAKAGAVAGATLDESPAEGGLNNPVTIAASAISGLFETPDYGADGLGSVAYSLSGADGAGTGLWLTGQSGAANEIRLVKVSDTEYEGRVGGAAGTLAFEVTIDSNTGEVTVTQFATLEHTTDGSSAAAHDDALSLGGAAGIRVVQTVTDADGDTDAATSANALNITFEDDGPKADAKAGAVAGATLDESPAEGGLNNPVTIAASAISGLFETPDYGADGLGSVAYSLSGADGAGTGLWLTGQSGAANEIRLVKVSDTEYEGRVGGAAGTLAFEVTIDSNTGEVTVTQFATLEHTTDGSSAAAHDDALSLGGAAGIRVVQTVTDADGDTDAATSANALNITFEDDGPKADAKAGAVAGATLDESPAEGGLNNPVTIAASAISGLFETPDYGADGLGSVAYSLSGADGAGTGLWLTGQSGAANEIRLVKVSDTEYEGRVGGAAGTLAFEVTIDSNTGEVTVTQFATLEHTTDGSSAAAHDDALSLGGAAGIRVVQTVTDADGDTDAATSANALNITFEDDGPKADAKAGAVAGATLDESPAEGGLNNPVTIAASAISGLFETPDYGADGLGSVAYSLSGADGAGTGLWLTGQSGAANEIRLVKVSDTEYEGRVGGAAGTLAFEVTIDSNTGEVTVTQFATLEHTTDGSSAAAHDDALSLGGAAGIRVVQTVTDADGDTDAATSANALNITFEDDGPKADAKAGAVAGATLDESPAEGGLNNPVTIAASAISGLFETPDYGADGLGSVAYSLSGADGAGTGLWLTGQSGAANEIRLVKVSDTEYEGRVGGAAGTLAFEVTIDSNTGEVTVTQFATLEHTTDGSSAAAHDDALSLGGAAGIRVVQTVTDADGDTDAATSANALNITFEDDGPKADAKAGAVAGATLDESPAEGGLNNPVTIAASAISGLFETPDYGADGLGSVAYSLSGADGAGTGLWLTGQSGAANEIRLVKVSDTEYEGRVGGAAGTLAFEVTIDSNTGEVTVTQFATLEHTTDGSSAAAHDDALSLGGAAGIRVVQTVTDADGDTDAATSANALNITFEDDGPKADAKAGAVAGATLDESPAEGGLNNPVTIAASAISGLFETPDYGADGLGSVAYSLSGADGAGTGLWLTGQSGAANEIRLVKVSDTEYEGRVGGAAGTLAFEVTIDSNTGEVTVTQFATLEHTTDGSSAAAHDDALSLGGAAGIRVVQTVTDADGDTDAATSANALNITFEDDGPKADAKAGAVAGATLDESPAEGGLNNPVTIAASAISGLFETPDYGADGLGSVAYSLSGADGAGTGLWLTGQSGAANEIRLVKVSDTEYEGRVGGAAGTLAFEVTIDSNTGEVTVTQFATLEHTTDGSSAAAHDDALSLGGAAGIRVVQTVTDADGDTDAATSANALNITFEDDGPKADAKAGAVAGATLDESPAEGGLNNPVTIAASAISGLFETPDYGADGLGSVAYSLSGADGAGTGLWLTGQSGAANEIRLVKVSDTEYEGRVGGAAGTLAFEVTIDSNTGEVTVTQFATLEHTTDGSSAAAHDDALSLGGAAGIRVVQTVTDADGDTDAATSANALNITFEDDGPKADAKAGAVAGATLDESPAEGGLNNPVTIAASAISGLFETPDYGADGLGSVAYSLSGADGAGTGLWLTGQSGAANEIRLVKVSDTEYEGRVGGAAGTLAFEVTIDSNTGEVTVTQFATLEHTTDGSSAAAHDDALSLGGAAGIRVVQTVTDADGDTDAATSANALNITFEDDGPKADAKAGAVAGATLDESPAEGGLNNPVTIAASAISGLFETPDYGADGLGSVAYSLSGADGAGTGLWLTGQSGAANEIRLVKVSDTEYEGRVGGAAGTLAFEVTIDSNTGEVTVTQFATLEHTTDGSSAAAHDDALSLGGAAGIRVVQTVTDADGDTDAATSANALNITFEDDGPKADAKAGAVAGATLDESPAEGGLNNPVTIAASAISGLFETPDYGADGLGSVAYSLSGADGAGTGLWLTGQSGAANEIRLVKVSDTEYEGRVGGAAGTLAFEVTIDSNTGEVTVTQFATLEHTTDGSSAAAHDDALSLGGAAGIRVVQTVTDADGDTDAATSANALNITFEDDGPKADAKAGAVAGATLDESPAEGGLNNPVTIAASAISGLFETPDYGADGLGSVAYSLSGADGAGTGLWLTGQSGAANEIRLVKVSDTEYEGRVGGAAGTLAFEVTIDSNTGEVTVTQFATLEHTTDGSSAAAHDDALSLGGAAGIRVVQTVTDADGDTDAATSANALNITFEDDGPKADAKAGAVAGATLDESPAEGGLNNPVTIAASAISGLFETPDYGADGLGSVAYSLSGADGAGTGLWLTGQSGAANEIRLVKVSDTEYEGRVGGAAGTLAFEVTIDSNTGEVTVTQFATLEHTTDGSSAAAHDDALSLGGAAGIRVVQTVTDADGDTDAATSANALNITFEDDGPKADAKAGAVAGATLDESPAEGGLNNPVTIAASAISGLFETPDYGADGLGSVAYSLSGVDGAGTGLWLTGQSGAANEIRLVKVSDTEYEGRVGGAAGTLAFEVTIDSNTGEVTVTQFATLEHTTDGSSAAAHDDALSLGGAAGIRVVQTVTDADGDTDAATSANALNITFEDDGPKADAKAGAVAGATLDESPAEGGLNNPVTIAASAISGLFETPDYGADGLGSVAYSLSGADGAGTGLWLTGQSGAANEIRLVKVSDTEYEGRVGGAAGTLAFEVTIDSNTGEVTVTQFATLEHTTDGSSAAAHDDALSLGGAAGIRVVQTVTDADGDTDAATSANALNITFEDDGPKADAKAGAVAGATLDESPAEGGLNNPVTIAASAISGLFETPDYGADGLGSVAYSLSGADGAGTGLWLTGQSGAANEIRLVKVSDTEYEGRVGGAAGTLAFEVTIDSNTGEVTVTQFATLEHTTDGSSAAAHDDALSLGGAAGIRVVQTVTDADGDTDAATSANALNITFEDDGPKADAKAGAVAGATLDESPAEGGLNNPVTIAASAISGLFETPDYGADGLGSVAYSLSGADGAGTGLWLTGQSGAANEIRLVKVSDTEYEGRVGGAAGTLAFEVTIDSNTGEVTVTQFATLEHTTDGSSAAAHDDALSLGGAAGIRVVQTVTDADGDTDAATSANALNITFEDDGPVVDMALKAGAALTLDETKGVKASDANANDEAVSLDANDIGYAKLVGSDLFTLTKDAGSDGEQSTSFKLLVGAPASGLVDTATNQAIVLSANAGGTEVLGKNTNGDVVFKVVLNASNGDVEVFQYRAIKHENASDHDESGAGGLIERIQAGSLKLEVTLTDKDGDSAKDDLDLGQVMRFEDDGPVVDMALKAGAALTLDETKGVKAGDANANDEAVSLDANDIGYAKLVGSDLFTLTKDAGSDGEQSTSFKLLVGAPASGLVDTATNQAIVLSANAGGTEVLGKNTNGDVVFKVVLNASNGDVEVFQYRAIKHENASDHDESGAGGLIERIQAGSLKLEVTLTDKDGDSAKDDLDLGQVMRFEDDGPVVDMALKAGAALTLDETKGVKAGDANANDEAVSLDANDIGYAKLVGSDLFTLTKDAGSDGEQSTLFKLLVGAPASGLVDTATNQAIVLSANAGGTEVLGKNTNGDVVFKVVLNASNGDVEVFQYRAIKHENASDHDESGAGGLIERIQAGSLKLEVTLTDKDGDSAKDDLDLGQVMRFEDDGPVVDMALKAGAALTLDETKGVKAGDANANDEAVSLDANDIGYAKLVGSDLFTLTKDAGSDGEQSTLFKLLVGAPASGLVDAATNQAIVLSANAGGTEVLGKNTNGDVVFKVVLNASNGDVEVFQYRAIKHENASDHDESGAGGLIERIQAGSLKLEVTLTDKDGDSAKDDLDLGQVMRFEDDGPVVDMALKAGAALTLDETKGVKAGDANANDEAVSLDANDIGYAKLVGSDLFTLTKDAGSDGEQSTLFKLLVGAPASGLVDTATNQAIVLSANAGGTEVLGKNTNGDVVFKVVLNASNGDVEVFQYRAIKHENASDHDESGAGGLIERIQAGSLKLEVTLTDKDGDSAKDDLDLGQVMRFEDDGPVVDMALKAGAALTLDETKGVKASDANANDEAVSLDANDIGYAKLVGSDLFTLTKDAGSDGEQSTSFKLLVGAPASGLVDTATNQAIVLSANAGGTEVLGKNTNGDVVFKVVLNASNGDVEVFQYRAIKHENASDHDESGAGGLIERIQAGSLKLEVTLTDKDGDSAKDDLDLGQVMRFEDDGPVVDMALKAGAALTLDETKGVKAGDANANDEAVSLDANDIGYAKLVGSDLFTLTKDAGSDGEQSTSFKLLVGAPASGLVDTATNQAIVLSANAGGTEVLGKNTNGDVVFKVVLNASNGDVEVFQYRAIKHENASDHDESGAGGLIERIQAGSLKLEVTLTDKDGDSAKDDLDLGQVMRFEDDGPTVGTISLVADEDNLPRGNNDTASGDAAQSNLTGTLPVNFGADGAGSVDFQGMHGMSTVIGNDNITYNWNAGTNTLTAYRTGGTLGVNDVFKIVVNPTTGQYAFTLLAAINHHAVADNTEGLVDPFVNLNYRVIDGDGDTAIGTLKVTIDDDVPKAITPEEGFVSNKAGVVKVFNLDLDSNIGNNVGADQPGSIRFINVVDGQQAQGIIDGELVNLTTVNGQLIKLYISNDGMIITGSTATSEAAVNSGNTVFKVTMLPDNDYNLANDKYSVEMFGKIGVVNTVNFSDLAGESPAGNVNFKIISDQDFPGYEVLITPKDRVNPDDTVGGTVNSSSTDISISNQWIEQGSGDSEILRLDYGQFAIVNNKFNIEKHFTVNGASFEIPQIQGSSSSRASINVKAFDANDNNQLNDDPLDAITRVVIFTSSGGVETVIADVASNTSVGGMTFNFLGTNGVNITGLQAHYQVRAYTADGYNRLEIDNISSTPFSIGGLGIQAIIDTEKEVKMTYDVRLTDSDGDSVDSSLEINIAPSLLKVGENINDTSSSNVPHTVGNDVGVIDGGRGADVLVGDVGGVKDVRIAFVLDESGSMSQNFGGSTRMDVLKQVMTDVLTELGNTPNANITVHLVKFASIVNGTGTFNITGGELQNALDFISGLQIQQGNLAGTNYEAALGQTALWFNSLTGTADVQQTLFLTDGAPTLYMDGNSTDYTNINAVYGHGNQTEEVLWENLFGEHAGNQATVDLFNHLNESNSRDLDGTQSYSVDTDGDGDFETISVNARSSGTTQSTSDLVRSTADNVNEVQDLQAHGTLRAVSIANNVSVYLQDIDSTGQPYVASSPGLLQDILNELNPFNSLNPVGSDIIQGNEADDLIFGDTLFTDKLAEDEGLNLRKGSGWDVFEELEASHGWSRQDTLNYIASHADELGKETVLSNGSTRSGGHDTISGGQGNDRIYGQEGNDTIDGGAGNDVIVGGTGNDTLTGGSGADQFVLVKGQGGASAGAAPIDTITDFEVNIDKIVINGNNITGVSVSTPVSNTYTITVNYSDTATEHFKVTLSNGALLNDSGKTHLNGVVISGGTATIDGTIVGAVLYLDLNANNQEDEGERLGITNQYGHVEWVVDLSKFDVNGDGQYVIGEARAVQTGGFDIDTGLSYEINLYGPVGSAVISPLTSLLQAQLEAGMDYETANAALVARLGLPEGTQIISFNPITGSGEVLAQNAGVMTAAIQFAEIAAIHYSTDESHVSFAVFEAISKALLELPEGLVADFSDQGFLQSISNHLGLDALVTADMIDYMAAGQKALETSILTLAPGEDALTAISKIQHVTQGIYAQAIEMALIGYLPLDALKNMSAVLKAYADGDITDEQLNSFEDKLSAVVVNWEENNVMDTSHQASLQTEHTVDDSSVKSEVNHEMAQEVNAVINDFMDEHNISLYYYAQQAHMPQEAQEQQPTEDQAEETVMHDDVVQDLLLDDHSLTMLANNPQLNGGNGNDVLHGTTGNDFIRGGQGNDTMTGGGGVDTFFWLSGDDDGGVDTITDFKANPVDQSSDASVLNLSDLLSDADLETNSLDNYLNVSTTEEGDTAIKVDPNGNGNFDAPAQTIILEDVDLTAVFATNNSHDIVNQMIANGNLIVEQ
ncbi:enhanced entry virulence factor RtxA [Legionella pneumophila]|uniref:enhanced entry virulence factor RtxA n=1 Tax=Legionella pneumophila TaxID=446 RepID=UPI0035A971CF